MGYNFVYLTTQTKELAMSIICHIQDQMHRDYLHSIFTFENGVFKVTRETDLGKFICALVKTTDYPVEQKLNEEKAVYFEMPTTSEMPSLFRKFCHITAEDQRRINDYLISIFNQDFITYYYVGRNLKLKQKDVILNFILSRKLVSRIGEVEQLKKRAYRAEEKAIEQITNRLKVRVQRQAAVIRKNIQEIQAWQ